MRKLTTVLTLLIFISGVFGAIEASASPASSKKVAVNSVKVGKHIKTYMINSAKHEVGVELQPQKLVKGKWRDLDWYDFHFVEARDVALVSHGMKKGTYRYVVTVYKYDKKGYAVQMAKYNTKKVRIK